MSVASRSVVENMRSVVLLLGAVLVLGITIAFSVGVG